jgi:hypothetical protein
MLSGENEIQINYYGHTLTITIEGQILKYSI